MVLVIFLVVDCAFPWFHDCSTYFSYQVLVTVCLFSVIFFIWGCTGCTVDVSSKVEGTGVKFAELVHVIDEVIGVIDVTAVL